METPLTFRYSRQAVGWGHVADNAVPRLCVSRQAVGWGHVADNRVPKLRVFRSLSNLSSTESASGCLSGCPEQDESQGGNATRWKMQEMSPLCAGLRAEIPAPADVSLSRSEKPWGDFKGGERLGSDAPPLN